MTIDEMKEKIDDYCRGKWCTDIGDGTVCPLYKVSSCKGDTDEETKANYELVYGKPQFTLLDIQSGYLCKLRNDKLCLVVQTGEDEWTLYDICNEAESGNENYNDDMIDKGSSSEYDIMEVYGYSTTFNLFDKEARKLLFKREEIEDIGKKGYEIKCQYNESIHIIPNEDEYKDKCSGFPIFLDIKGVDGCVGLSIDSAKELIKSLQEIVDYVEGE